MKEFYCRGCYKFMGAASDFVRLKDYSDLVCDDCKSNDADLASKLFEHKEEEGVNPHVPDLFKELYKKSYEAFEVDREDLKSSFKCTECKRNVSTKNYSEDCTTCFHRQKVDHPDHYQGNRFEVIDIIEDFDLGFNLGNAIKYILRASKKECFETDLKKAIWYIQRELNS